jgi:hypothetical protein
MKVRRLRRLRQPRPRFYTWTHPFSGKVYRAPSRERSSLSWIDQL